MGLLSDKPCEVAAQGGCADPGSLVFLGADHWGQKTLKPSGFSIMAWSGRGHGVQSTLTITGLECSPLIGGGEG